MSSASRRERTSFSLAAWFRKRIVLSPTRPFQLLLINGLIFGPFGIYFAGLSVNHLLFALSIGASLLWIISRSRVDIQMVLGVLLLMSFLMFYAVALPLTFGGVIGFAIAEGKGMLWLFLFVPALLSMKLNKWPQIVNGTVPVVLFICCVISLAWGAANLGHTEFAFILRSLLGYFSGIAGSASDNIFIGPMPDGSFRVMWNFSVILPLYLYYAFEAFVGWKRCIILMLLAAAILASGSRAIIFASLFLIFAASPRNIKLILSLFVVFLSILVIANDMEFTTRVLNWSDEFSPESARYSQFFALLREFEISPIVGNGLGHYSPDVIRNTSAPYSYELTYNALLAKLGLLGVVWGLIIGFVLTSKVHMSSKSYILLFALFLMSATNPYLFSLVGVYSLLFGVFYEYARRTEEKHEGAKS